MSRRRLKRPLPPSTLLLLEVQSPALLLLERPQPPQPLPLLVVELVLVEEAVLFQEAMDMLEDQPPGKPVTLRTGTQLTKIRSLLLKDILPQLTPISPLQHHQLVQ